MVYPIYLRARLGETDVGELVLTRRTTQKRGRTLPKSMVRIDHFQESAGERRRVLLIAEEPSLRSLISTLLVTMGCTCVVSSITEVDVLLERETFDAVVLKLNHSPLMTEQALLKIKKNRPSLSKRILVIRSDLTDPQTIELVERYDLRQVSHETLLQQLWTTLQDLFAFPRSPKLVPHSMETAQMIFDSLSSPLPAGVRGSLGGSRRLAYQHKIATIDLLIAPKEDRARISITGQVLYSVEKSDDSKGLPVLLISGMRTVARTSTNQFGEFSFECEPVEDACVEMRLGKGAWVSLPLGKMDWMKGSMVELKPES